MPVLLPGLFAFALFIVVVVIIIVVVAIIVFLVIQLIEHRPYRPGGTKDCRYSGR